MQHMSITDKLSSEAEWLAFLQYKTENSHISRSEQNQIEKYIQNKVYLHMKELIDTGSFPDEYPAKCVVNKEGANGTGKKRVVYTFRSDVNITLKFIAFHLRKYDDIFSDNCYSFRQGYGVKQALRKISRNRQNISHKYCLKVDIKNYFNSIDETALIKKLEFVRRDDEKLYHVFRNILTEDKVWEKERILSESHGAMAGIPIAPFFANIYLTQLDKSFSDAQIEYFRYSDDLLIFADSLAELVRLQRKLYEELHQLGLDINHDKESISAPEEEWEFLGFSYNKGVFDLSGNTKRKIKAKIRRKSEALRRWQRKKKLTPDKAAIGFIRAMNRKFYGGDGEDEFTWSRWFFPNITTDRSLREIDAYMQEYIRYTVTGRHYKGNYRISYEQMKRWGYKSLVHEYYKRADCP